jgi:hypothetical protein
MLFRVGRVNVLACRQSEKWQQHNRCHTQARQELLNNFVTFVLLSTMPKNIYAARRHLYYVLPHNLFASAPTQYCTVQVIIVLVPVSRNVG